MNPNLDNALAVARVLDVSVEDLVKEAGIDEKRTV